MNGEIIQIFNSGTNNVFLIKKRIMRKTVGLFLFIFILGFDVQAQITFNSEIGNILYNNCTTCHRTGGIATFPIENYTDAFAHKTDIASYTSTGKMPPWPPDANYVHHAFERILSAGEVQKIQDWVNSGAPEGVAPAPVLPIFPSNGELAGTADTLITMPSYTIPNLGGSDVYRCFPVASGLTIDKSIRGIEAIPGNRSVVHHVLIYYDTTGQCLTLDAGDPGPGYTGFGGVGIASAKLVGAWVPGSTPYFLPSGMGIKVSANGYYIMQIHYPASGVGQSDNTSLRIFYTSGAVRNVSLDAVLNFVTNMTDGPLIIPANQTKTFHEEYTIPPLNISVLSVGPHMHLIGRSIKSYAVTPGLDTIPFISIPEWDFHWQGSYGFKKIIKVPASSTIYASAFYDNTTANPDNPNHPPQLVTAGENTSDEMMLIYFAWLPYFPGDENIVIDNTPDPLPAGLNQVVAQNKKSVKVFPNPASALLNLSFPEENADYRVEMYDVLGKIQKEMIIKNSELTPYIFSIQSIHSGIYFLSVIDMSGQIIQREKILKTSE